MKVIIEDTNTDEELSIVDRVTGTDWTIDLLGNAGIHKDADTDAVTMSQEDFVYWKTYIEGHEATEREIAKLAERAGVEYHVIQWPVFGYMGGYDYEDERKQALVKLEELRKAYGLSE